MMTNSRGDENKHVAVFAFPFGSHLEPLLNLVIKLARAAPHCSFSFIGTHKSNEILFSNPNNNIPDNIKAYSISDGIPEGHILSSHPVEKIDLFLKTGPHNLQQGIDLAVADTKQRVTCIISNAFVPDSLIVAQDLHVPWIPVWLAMSCTLSSHFYTHAIRDHCANATVGETISLGNFLPGLWMVRVEDLPQDVINGGENETLFSKTLASLGSVLPQAKAVIMNFFEELDPPLFVQDIRSKLQSLLYLAPLLASSPSSAEEDSTGCLSWLDKQGARSVVYVSFGTVVAPPPHELMAVAEALEESGFPFLWSLKDDVKSVLPNGFVERTSMRGKIVPWAPQTEVLAHSSVGVFVTHCGCNSVIQSICNGVPMICRPFFGDQGITGRMVQDAWEIGVLVEGRVITKNRLVKSMNLILVDKEGNKIRENAIKVKKIVEVAAKPDGKAAQDFNTLVEIIST
ncbi:anthocyanidin 3-O-glucosyltransferase 7-like [Arachis stenosperma]|uniref:anthocyanidin 3-O-glucosyltransferase 7-like n=1 Tax=Arachis stenosperma TaxID=217475 RepID=UPI0025ABFF2F|nr:anthocyanidin 3-O-glucosyltransferase 7-like [Arachis stenosperma]